MTSFVDDIGTIISAEMAPHEIEDKVKKLSCGQKFHLLKHHVVPNADFVFPTKFYGGCQRSFQLQWLKEYAWMVYSIALDGAFCISCTLFGNDRKGLGTLVNCPFTKWHKKKAKVHQHSTFKYHQEALSIADHFIASIKNPYATVPVMHDTKRAENIARNRHIVKCIAECVLFCGRQCIPLRGDNEGRLDMGNPGNFLSLLRMMSNHDDILRKHLEQPMFKNATYVSPSIQNEIIHIIGKDVIQAKLIEEIKNAKFFSIMADEVTSHNVEQMALCVRFVDEHQNIREEFLQFSKPERTTGYHLAEEIKSALQELGIKLENMRGQGYDGAASMSSNRIGVQARIMQDAPKAFYIHCSGHCLNLVILHSCALPAVRNMIAKVKEVSLFFKNSPKRNDLLIFIVHHGVTEESKRKSLLELCRTRWAERHEAHTRFYQTYVYIVKSFEVIAYDLHRNEYQDGKYATNWDNKSKQEASSLLAAITSFDFIITFLTVYRMLSQLEGITVKLQSKAIDILEANEMVSIKDGIVFYMHDTNVYTFLSSACTCI